EAAVGPAFDRCGAAEVEVALAPADELVAPALEPVELGWIGPAFAVHLSALEVDARRLDCLLDRQPVVNDVDDDLEDGPAEPDRPRAADDEAREPPGQRERRRHHARQPGARTRLLSR